jgi:hypothetical protein
MERLGALTGADRKFIDDLVKDVNDGWNEADPSRPLGMQYVLWSPQGVVANTVFMGRFKGSDDYLRTKVRSVSALPISLKPAADVIAVRGIHICGAFYCQIYRLFEQGKAERSSCPGNW